MITELDALTTDKQHRLLHGPQRASTDNAGELLTIDRQQDCLTPHSNPRVVGLDWERDGWRVSYNGGKPYAVKKDDLSADANIAKAEYVIVEQAHMKERNVYSVAQVYTADELQNLTFRSKIRLFPGMPGQLARAARDVGHVLDVTDEFGNAKPDKELDAATMSAYAIKHPKKFASWRTYKLPHEDASMAIRPARQALRDEIRAAMNEIRVAWNNMPTAEKYELPEVKLLCQILDTEFDSLTDGIKEQFGIRRSRNGIRVERMSAAMTVFLMVRHRDGNLRVRPDGKFVGVRFILRAVGMSASYTPNMARSQLTHHGMRHYKGGRDGGCRSEYMLNLRQFIYILRDTDCLTVDKQH